MAARFARVAIESPLPQLDRLFDYRIPDQLAQTCLPGVRVLVPFGKGGAPLAGFVIEVTDHSDYDGDLNFVDSVVSPVAVFPEASYRLARAIADRQAGVLAEVTKLAVPNRSVRVEKAWLAQEDTPSRFIVSGAEAQSLTVNPGYRLDVNRQHLEHTGRTTLLAEPRLVELTKVSTSESSSVAADIAFRLQVQGWIAHMAAFAVNQLRLGKQCILIVPDFRDQHRLKDAFTQIGLDHLVVDFSADQTPSARYAAYLRTLRGGSCIVIGSRAAAYAPLPNLGGIALFDDSDFSLQEPTAPYVHTRDVVLLRQQQSGCNLLMLGHSRSPEVQRLIELGYLTDQTVAFAPPRISVTDPGMRVDGASFQVAREAFESGGAVLVQVANTGHSTGTYCGQCGERSRCRTCNGPIFVDSNNAPRCRWCSAINLGLACHACGSTKIRQGVAGSSRTAAELGRAFPGVNVVEATWERRVETLKAGKRLVVATPGAEPVIEGGYAAVILLDGQRLLAKDTLRATEQAVNLWSNAVSLLAPGGRCVGVGLATPLGKKFALWDQAGIATEELANRRELGFPPHFRMASVSGPRELVDQAVAGLASMADRPDAIEVLGPLLQSETGGGKVATIASPTWRYLIRYEYAAGERLAKELKARALVINSGNRAVSAKSGRVSRAVRVRMDDSEVI